MKRILCIPLLALALGACASSTPIVVAEERYEAAYQAAKATASRRGFVLKKEDARKGQLTLEKICGCSDLIVSFAPPGASGQRAVTFTGTAVYGAFHSDVAEVVKAVRRVAEAP